MGRAPRGHTIFLAVMVVCVYVLSTPLLADAVYTATTTVSLTVCGDGITSGAEFCDDGTNTGAYSSSIAGRQCDPLCAGYGKYCGDSIIQTYYGEECDDGNNTSGDYCDATCQNETSPVVVGGGGTGGSGGGGGRGGGNHKIPGASATGQIPFTGDTNVIVQGTAYPGATVTILRDGSVERVVEADDNAVFSYTLTGQTAGIATLGFWALDRSGRKSITYSATFQIIQNAVTTLSGILLPPTLAVVPEKAQPGSTVSFEGSAAPSTSVHAYVDENEQPEETVASSGGDWVIAYDTTPLGAEAFHTVKANYVDRDNPELNSGFSQIASFYVGTHDAQSGVTADLNGDGLVNLTDFSILLFNWNTASVVADIDGNGIVSLPDFSIMLFYWTG